jgi:hypothetical protein
MFTIQRYLFITGYLPVIYKILLSRLRAFQPALVWAWFSPEPALLMISKSWGLFCNQLSFFLCFIFSTAYIFNYMAYKTGTIFPYL